MAAKENKYQNESEHEGATAESKKRDEILDDSQLCDLRKIIYKIYIIQKEIPTLNSIFVAAKQQLDYCGTKTLLRKILCEKLSFKFKICRNNGPLPIERHKTAYHRVDYLIQLRSNEELGPNKRPVVYFNEICLNYKKDGNDDCDVEQWYLFLACLENGFIEESKLLLKCELENGKYPKDMDKKIFLHWLENILIPNLPQNSIVIFTHSPQHNKQKEILPNMLSTKKQIKEWLRKNNIAYEDDMLKGIMLLLVKKHKPKNNYFVDDLLESAGHTALRVPIYTDLNPLEIILNMIKERAADKSGSQFEKIVDEAIASITKEEWTKEFDHVKELRKEYLQNENLLDEEIDNLYLNLEDPEGEVLSSDTADYYTDFSYDVSDSSDESYNYRCEDNYLTDESDNADFGSNCI